MSTSTASTSAPNRAKIEPVPKFMAVMSPEGWARQAASNAPQKDGKNLFWTVDPSVELPIRMGLDPKSTTSRPPMTVLEVMANTVRKYPDEPALRVKRNGTWYTHTWAQYLAETKRFAKGLIAIGMERHQGVSIIGFNSPEWTVANMGTIFAGGIAAGIYTTNNAEAAWYVAHHSDSAVVVAEDAVQASKFLETKSRLPKLKYIVQYTGTIKAGTDPCVISWRDFLALGDKVTDSALADRMNYQRPGHCCMLIYTSGTTGNPKAVMLSHDNITWTASVTVSTIDVNFSDRIVSYLPLSHIAAQIIDVHGPMLTGACVSFADADALKGTLVNYLQEVRPTIFFGVPRVWEKIEERMRAVGAANGPIKQALGTWAKSVGLAGSWAKLNKEEMPWGWTIADKLVFNNVKTALGLDQTKYRATAAAPISKETLEYFMSLDLHLLEIYGMSESSGPHTINTPDSVTMFSVGRPFPGAFHKLDNQDAKGNGEICMWGRHVFMGYMKQEDATRETIDGEGYMRTGDLGRVDENGFLYITGRIKELLITAGGENVAPVPIEDAIKAELPIVSNVMVIGDKRKYLAALLTLKTDPDSTGMPSKVLSETVCSALKAAGIDCTPNTTTTTDVIKNPAFLAYIQKGVDRANKQAVSAAQRVQKWTFLENDFSLQSELTPTMKLKRRVVLEKYGPVIESLYVEGPAGAAAVPAPGNAKAKL